MEKPARVAGFLLPVAPALHRRSRQCREWRSKSSRRKKTGPKAGLQEAMLITSKQPEQQQPKRRQQQPKQPKRQPKQPKQQRQQRPEQPG